MRLDIRPHETAIVGPWLDTGSRVEGDAACARIAWLVAERLERLAEDSEAGRTLYRDPRDGRLWERTHPHRHLRGGGPPRLTVVGASAAARYGLRPPPTGAG
jgi:hypothetical protein